MGGSLFAQSKTEIPVIDRSVFFGNPEVSGGQLSPNGKYISFLKEHNGIMNIWMKKFDEPFANAKRMTNLKRSAAGYFRTNDGKYILYAKDNGGNENFNIFAVDSTSSVDDATSMKLKQLVLGVAGKERVNNVDCWNVLLTNTEQPSDKSILWIDAEKSMALKMEQTLPALGNAVLMATLK